MANGEYADICLKNDRLAVQISHPGAVYKGSRFDWNGFVTQVTLDGRHTFCVPEALVPGKGSGGQGFCGEFGIEKALGYDETYVNNYFIKIGVGQVKKLDNEPYNFFKSYPVLPLVSSVILKDGKVLFQANSIDNDRYSYEYSKEIKLDENFMQISYMLRNTGSKKIETTEYCHNFIGIDNNNVTGSYKLKVPGRISLEKVSGEIISANETITWPQNELKQEFYCIIKDYNSTTGYSWELYNSLSGVGLREIDDFVVSKFAVWGSTHVISPETFINLELEPDESISWSRKYEFFY